MTYRIEYKSKTLSQESCLAFEITVGLREGHNNYFSASPGVIHSVEEVVSLVKGHLRKCSLSRIPFLNGKIIQCQLVHAELAQGRRAPTTDEPAVTYSGITNLLCNSGLSDKEAIEFLHGLASVLGRALGQERVYVTFNGATEILEGKVIVTGAV